MPQSPQELYLDLLKNTLLHRMYTDFEVEDVIPQTEFEDGLYQYFRSREYRLVRKRPYDSAKREDGSEWIPFSHTMIGKKRLDNLQFCIEHILKDEIPGDLLEAGVWRGGASIFMKGALKVFGDTSKTVWLADSFEGVPPPNEALYPLDTGIELHKAPELAIPQEEVKKNFESYGLYDERIKFIPGWFKDTLHQAPVQQLSLLRLDGDLYESTMDALKPLYDLVSPGGFIVIDDYGAIDACKQAVQDFRNERGITEPIETIDWTGAFWRKA